MGPQHSSLENAAACTVHGATAFQPGECRRLYSPRGRKESDSTERLSLHAHRVDDAVQPSPTLSSPSPPAFSLSQHQGLFQGISFMRQVAEVLELQHQSFH